MATNQDTRENSERYQRAAEETLDQLDWCINDFHRIRKPRIAEAIAKNRSTIRRQMRGDD